LLTRSTTRFGALRPASFEVVDRNKVRTKYMASLLCLSGVLLRWRQGRGLLLLCCYATLRHCWGSRHDVTTVNRALTSSAIWMDDLLFGMDHNRLFDNWNNEVSTSVASWMEKNIFGMLHHRTCHSYPSYTTLRFRHMVAHMRRYDMVCDGGLLTRLLRSSKTVVPLQHATRHRVADTGLLIVNQDQRVFSTLAGLSARIITQES
jgi:hypothetical protein